MSEPIVFESAEASTAFLLVDEGDTRIVMGQVEDVHRNATPADLIAALQQNDALRAEVLRGLYEVRGMATDHARQAGKCIGCHKDKRLTRIVPGAGKIGLCMDCANVIGLYGRDTE